MWNKVADSTPEPKSHIIALTSDGGTAIPLYVHPQRGFIGADLEVYESDFLATQCEYWTLAPDGYAWWCERGDDGAVLEDVDTEATLNEESTAPVAVLEEAVD